MPPFDLQRLQTHDEKEWDAFFRFYEGRLYHFARRFSASISDETARDLVQETLLAAYEELCGRGTRLKEGGRFLGTWLFGICKNRCRDFVKTTELHARKEDELQTDPTLPLPLGNGSLHSNEYGGESDGALGMGECLKCLPEGATRDTALDCFTPLPPDTVQVLVASLNRATPPLRATLILRFVVGLKYREIADALDISLEAVKGRLYDAAPALRRRLERDGALNGGLKPGVQKGVQQP